MFQGKFPLCTIFAISKEVFFNEIKIIFLILRRKPNG